jgi:hypothetical protein
MGDDFDVMSRCTWPQGKHPFVHHDPDEWAPWILFPARWLLTNERSWISLDLWECDYPLPLSQLLERVQGIQGLLPPDEVKTLWIALDDIYKATNPAPRGWQGYRQFKEQNHAGR